MKELSEFSPKIQKAFDKALKRYGDRSYVTYPLNKVHPPENRGTSMNWKFMDYSLIKRPSLHIRRFMLGQNLWI